MRSYLCHKRIVRFMKIVNDMQSNICIYPSRDLAAMCCEANLSEPVYSEVCNERSKVQFSVQVMSSRCKVIESNAQISATGYLLRDKFEAVESAALAMLDLLMYRYGVRSPLYSDLAFIRDWPAYSHISSNLKATCSGLLDIMSDLSSLIDGIHESGSLFESEKAKLSSDAGNPGDANALAGLVAVLSDCQAELQGTHEFLFAGTRESMENVQWRCHSHRFYHRSYYEALHSLHEDLEIKMDCSGTLRSTLDAVCERSGYLVEFGPWRCESENRYITDIVLIKRSNVGELEKKFNISSAVCSGILKCQHDVMYRGIKTVCAEEGLKIIDAGYLDMRDMQKENREFKHEVPLLCNVAGKIRAVVQNAFKNIDILSEHHYRRLKDSKLPKELRLSLADCICEFSHIMRCLNEEVKKMEIYSSHSSLDGEHTAAF